MCPFFKKISNFRKKSKLFLRDKIFKLKRIYFYLLLFLSNIVVFLLFTKIYVIILIFVYSFIIAHYYEKTKKPYTNDYALYYIIFLIIFINVFFQILQMIYDYNINKIVNKIQKEKEFLEPGVNYYTESNDYEGCLEKYDSVKKNFCEAIFLKRQILEALNKNDVNICKFDYCKKIYALLKDEINICYNIENDDIKNNCIINIAINTKNVSLCEYLNNKDSEKYNLCMLAAARKSILIEKPNLTTIVFDCLDYSYDRYFLNSYLYTDSHFNSSYFFSELFSCINNKTG